MRYFNVHITTLRLCVCFFCLLVWTGTSQAQETIDEVTPEEVLEAAVPEVDIQLEDVPLSEYPRVQPPPQRDIDDAAWQRTLENIDYSKDLPTAKKTTAPRDTTADTSNTTAPTPSLSWWNNISGGSQTMLQVVCVILLTLLVVWLVWRYFQAPANARIKASDGTEITLDNLEAYIHETDLDRFLRLALADGNYAQALRVYYLQIIKDLAAKGHIQWSREKTNRAYLREMRKHPLYDAFGEATRHYEAAWYGKKSLADGRYQALAGQMRGLLARI
jgi:Domain of unknown function (DUF4129)